MACFQIHIVKPDLLNFVFDVSKVSFVGHEKFSIVRNHIVGSGSFDGPFNLTLIMQQKIVGGC